MGSLKRKMINIFKTNKQKKIESINKEIKNLHKRGCYARRDFYKFNEKEIPAIIARIKDPKNKIDLIFVEKDLEIQFNIFDKSGLNGNLNFYDWLMWKTIKDLENVSKQKTI